MKKIGRVALRRRSWERLLSLLLLVMVAFTVSGKSARAADESAACQMAVGRLVSIQGPVELMRAGQNTWSPVSRLDTRLCAGDKLHTGGLSRAALFILPETVVRVDQNTTISITETAGEVLVEFARCEVVAKTPDERPSCGAGYFISRFPKKFKVNTPFFNAAVEGTEFMVAVRDDASELSVFEGKVRALITRTRRRAFGDQRSSAHRRLCRARRDPNADQIH